MIRYKQDKRRQKIFSKLDNDPNAMKAKIQTQFKRGHWEGALKTLNRYSYHIKQNYVDYHILIY